MQFIAMKIPVVLTLPYPLERYDVARDNIFQVIVLLLRVLQTRVAVWVVTVSCQYICVVQGIYSLLNVISILLIVSFQSEFSHLGALLLQGSCQS